MAHGEAVQVSNVLEEDSRTGVTRRKLVFAYRPAVTESVFTAAHLATLAELCDVADFAPLENFDDARAQKLLADAEILVTGWGCPKLEASLLQQAPKLRLVAHAAGTVKNFIAPEIFAAGITVCNAVSANALPVAEFTLAAILFSNKQVLRYRDLYRARREASRAADLSDPGVGNWRKTIGLSAASRIGRRGDRAAAAVRPRRAAARSLLHRHRCRGASVVEGVGLDELMQRSDVVSIHAPALDSTRHMIDARRIALLRDGATLINTARGSLIDQPALEAELMSGRISAVLDVTTPDTLPASSPLYELPNVLLTPHIAGALGGERERLGSLVVAEIERFVRGIPLAHAIAADTLHLQA